MADGAINDGTAWGWFVRRAPFVFVWPFLLLSLLAMLVAEVPRRLLCLLRRWR